MAFAFENLLVYQTEPRRATRELVKIEW